MDITTLKTRLPNYPKYLVCLAVFWVIELVLLCLLVSGTAHIGCKGIRLDSNGNIYVGLTKEIRVFDKNGERLRSISPKTSKGYSFEIDGDKLFVDCASASYVMDLNGTVLELRSYRQLPSIMKTPKTISISETIYHIQCSNFFYRVTIEEHGEKTVAVQMPVFDLLVEIVFCASVVSMFVFVLVLLRKLRSGAERNRHNYEKKGPF